MYFLSQKQTLSLFLFPSFLSLLSSCFTFPSPSSRLHLLHKIVFGGCFMVRSGGSGFGDSNEGSNDSVAEGKAA